MTNKQTYAEALRLTRSGRTVFTREAFIAHVRRLPGTITPRPEPVVWTGEAKPYGPDETVWTSGSYDPIGDLMEAVNRLAVVRYSAPPPLNLNMFAAMCLWASQSRTAPRRVMSMSVWMDNGEVWTGDLIGRDAA